MTENALIVIEIRCKFLKLSAITISNSLQILFCYVFLKFTPPQFVNFALQNKPKQDAASDNFSVCARHG